MTEEKDKQKANGNENKTDNEKPVSKSSGSKRKTEKKAASKSKGAAKGASRAKSKKTTASKATTAKSKGAAKGVKGRAKKTTTTSKSKTGKKSADDEKPAPTGPTKASKEKSEPTSDDKLETASQKDAATSSKRKRITPASPKPEPAPAPEKPQPDPAPQKPVEPQPAQTQLSSYGFETSPNEDPASDEDAKQPFNRSVAFMLFIGLAGLFYVCSQLFANQMLLLFAGMFIFLGCLPGFKVEEKNKTRRFAQQLGILLGISIVLFVVLKLWFHDQDASGQTEILIIFATLLGIRLIIWPIYSFEADEYDENEKYDFKT